MSSQLELIAELSSAGYSLGTCHWVKVTHLNKPNDFYVRPTAYDRYMHTVEAFGGPVEESRLTPGSVVVFKSQVRNGYVRGEIKSVRVDGKDKICQMFSLDYGYLESVYADCLKTSKREGIPALSVHCQIELLGREFNKIAVEDLLFRKTDIAKLIVKGQTADRLIVKLLKFDDANMSASRLERTVPPKLCFTYKRCLVGDSFPVRVQSGDTLQDFYVADMSDFKDYVAELTDFPTFLKLETEMRPEDLKAGKPVAVYTEFKYERAVVKDVTVPGKKAIVQLVDLGKIIEIDVPRSRLKALERECYFLHPALAIYVSAKYNQAWDNSKPELLYPGHQFVVTVLKVGKDLEIPNIVSLNRVEF